MVGANSRRRFVCVLRGRPPSALACFPPYSCKCGCYFCFLFCFFTSVWRTPVAHIQTGALPWKSTERVATPPWPRKTPWKIVLSRRRRSKRRSRKRRKMTSASPSREATALPTHTTTPTPVHKHHFATPLLPPTSHLLFFLLLLHPRYAFPQHSVGEIPFAGDLYIL